MTTPTRPTLPLSAPRDEATTSGPPSELERLRARAEKAEAATARVRALHYTRGRNILGEPVCAECSPLKPMPCPTLQALDTPEAGRD